MELRVVGADIVVGVNPRKRTVTYVGFFFFLVGYVEERPWGPIQSPNKGKKKKVSS